MIASSALEAAPKLPPSIATVMKSTKYASTVVTIAMRAVIIKIISTLLTWSNAGGRLCTFLGF